VNQAEKLLNLDRCPRLAYWAERWEAPSYHPNEVLRRAVDAGLMSSAEDPGQYAGDTVMTLAAERTLDVDGSQYDCALHNAALADILVTVLRGSGAPWARPGDLGSLTPPWESSAFLAPSGVRLHRVLVIDRWSEDRFRSEMHSWRTLGEVCRYKMPMTMRIALIGQRKHGRHHSPWSKGWLHPRSRNLRIRKRTGESFSADWKECWRETSDFSRDKWLEQMADDGVMNDILFEKEIPVPDALVVAKINSLADRKLEALASAKGVPDPNPSVCDWPTPCVFRKCCWEFTAPSERAGFVRIESVLPHNTESA